MSEVVVGPVAVEHGSTLLQLGEAPELETAAGVEGMDDANLVSVRVPMTGALYLRPAPDQPAFAPVGSVVAARDVVALIEVMKTYNPIKAPEGGTIIRWLVEDGVDFVHVSNWDSFRPPTAHPDSPKMLTTWFREAVGPGMPLIATGGVWTPAQADEVLGHGADLVGLGRAAIGNAAWPRDAATAGWKPARPPYTTEHLRAEGLGPALVDYMRAWPDFVVDEG